MRHFYLGVLKPSDGVVIALWAAWGFAWLVAVTYRAEAADLRKTANWLIRRYADLQDELHRRNHED